MATSKAVVPTTTAGRELATIELPNPTDIAEIMQDNFGDSGIGVFDLPRVRVPGAGGLAWTVPTEDGPVPAQSITGVILHHRTWRAYWSNPFGTGDNAQPPDCQSKDGKIGEPQAGFVAARTGMAPSGVCATCPLNEWGSVDPDDDDKNGKACKEIRALFFLMEGDMLPTLVPLPAMSLKPFNDYLMMMTAKVKKPFWKVATTFSLQSAKNVNGIVYSFAVPHFAGLLSDDDVETVRMLKETMVPLLESRIAVERGDVDGEV